MAEGRELRVVAVLAARNEARFLGACLDNLRAQGVLAYVCDNGSTDETGAIARARLGDGVIGVEDIPFDGTFRWREVLGRKEQLFQQLEADWLMHVDADEIHLPPRGEPTVRAALARVDAQGYDAVEFDEFTFIPTLESPEHEHPDFQRTLRSYYPFMPASPHCVRALKKQAGRMEIAWSGGHHVRFEHEVRLAPTRFRMRHYQFLSRAHAASKYLPRQFDREEVERLGWHGWRPELQEQRIRLPEAARLRHTSGDEDLDPSQPWTRHWLHECMS